MIEIRNLTRRYGSTVAVSDVSLTIARGEVVGLLGHNGAGKTTVMKMLTGFLEPSSGTITVGGVDVVQDRAGVQKQIGYLPENAPLYPEMLVQEYLLMMAELRGVPADRRERDVAEAVQQTGLGEHLLHPISTLSKGYRQRVGIAQAIVHKPDVLVLDEPTNGLDPTQIQSIRELIRRLGKNTTIILSTHILQEIEAVCDRVLVLIDGQLVANSRLTDLLSTDAVRVTVNTGATDVERRLRDIEGVQSVRRLGADEREPGFEVWIVEHTGAALTQTIIGVGLNAGWTFGSIGRDHRTLESVFERLQAKAAEQVPAQVHPAA